MTSESHHKQGVGAKVVWGDGAPFYALKPELAQAFHWQNSCGVHLVTSHWSNRVRIRLAGARILVLGPGVGTDIYALAPFGPASMVAVDNSKKMVEILQHQLEPGRDLKTYIEESCAPFGDVPEGVCAELWERTEYFEKNDTKVQVLEMDAWNIPEASYDIVYANQVAHWMISQKKCTVREFLRHARSFLGTGGLLLLGESSDFVVLKNTKADRLLLRSGLTAHPCYGWIHEELKEGAKEYGIDHPLPKKGDARTHMFFQKSLGDDAKASGFELIDWVQREFRYEYDPVEAFADRAPMYLGAHDPEKLPFMARQALIEKAADRIRVKHKDDPKMGSPLREQFFYFVLRAA